MKYFSMFSGIGGFEVGIEKATNGKWKCVGYSEIDKYAIKTYKKHFPKHKNYGDATKIIPEELPDFDLLCGGFPCQAFSVAGKRMGFEDTRGTLFFEVARIAKIKRPRFLLLENVKGLLNHSDGRTIAVIFATLDELGYNLEWEVLNSKYFGVAQNRERIFIIGHLREGSGRQIFPLGQSSKTFTKQETQSLIELEATKGNSQGARIYSTQGISQTINSGGGGMGAKTGLYVMPVLTPTRKEKRQNGRRFKNPGEEMFTLTGQDQHGVMVMNCLTEAQGRQGSSSEFIRACETIGKVTGRIRRLTPTECERLQGFDDGWTKGISDTQRYKQLGNAVTTNVIEAIVSKLIEVNP